MSEIRIRDYYDLQRFNAFLNRKVKQLEDEINILKDPWISVKDNPPKNGEEVSAIGFDGSDGFGDYAISGQFDWYGDLGQAIDTLTGVWIAGKPTHYIKKLEPPEVTDES